MPHPLAGQPAPDHLLIDPAALERAYYDTHPDPENPRQLVSFGTSGHRGTPAAATFNEAHILAITQAICDYRRAHGINGPVYLGKDSHAASRAAERTALEVLAANGVVTFFQQHDGVTPTPVISRAILTYNQDRHTGLADGIIITPSHNPPADGGFKYNPPHGGPADTEVTGWIERRANEYLRAGNHQVRRIPCEAALKADCTHAIDMVRPYLQDLASVVNLDAIRAEGVRIGVDPLGGASLPYWEPLAEMAHLRITVVNQALDPTFRFMTVDHDGKIRMDCSSPFAMAGLVRLKDDFDIAFGNDPDADRHGIVTPSGGLMDPNHYLAVAIDYLLTHRAGWSPGAAVGKTLVSSALIDRIVHAHARRLFEVPVGFKWFAPGLYDGTVCFGGEESAGASFLRHNGRVWTTDKDGLILGLLAAEIAATTGRDPAEHHRRLVAVHGESWYRRLDTPVSPEQKDGFKRLTPETVKAMTLAGDPITAKLTTAPGNGAAIGGLKVTSTHGWFAARPSGTENIYKLYAESFRSSDHLQTLLGEAQAMVAAAVQP
jgi:phosphoglucomutase